jgi:conjugal transfer pilus assembly protein TraV
MKKVIIILLGTLISACSVLPYENDVSCRLEDNYGECMSIQQSYDGNAGHDRRLVPGKRVNINGGDSSAAISSSGRHEQGPADMYVNELYREMAMLIREPVTPMVKAPKQMRTLILTYTNAPNRKTLYMPRYVYSIVEDAQFVIDQYFGTPERDAVMFEPRGSN